MRTFFLFPLSLLALANFAACSLNKTEESQKDRSMALLNERKYDQSVQELEASLQSNPRDRSTALLLSMAHVGKANAEMLQLFGMVLGRQGNPPPGVLSTVQCSDEPWEDLRDKSIECIVTRILQQVPDEPNRNVIRAQMLLREYYPQPAATAADVNFFAAYVELYRVLNRVRVLSSPAITKKLEELRLEEKTFENLSSAEFEEADAQFSFIVRELKAMGDELMHIFRRLKYSYSKLAKYTASIDGKPLLEYKEHKLVFDEEMSVARIAKFVIAVLNDEEGEADKRINNNISGLLNKAAPEIMKLARKLRYASGPAEAWDKISTSFKFERAIKQFLRGLQGGMDGRSPNADLSAWMVEEVETATNVMWENPPGIFGDFVQSLRDSWNGESMRPLVAYSKISAPEWRELSEILKLWDKVRANGDDRFEGRKMSKTLVQRRENDPQYLAFPVTVNAGTIKNWLSEIVREAHQYEKDYERGKFSVDNIPPSADRVALVREAWTRTKSWLEKNVLTAR